MLSFNLFLVHCFDNSTQCSLCLLSISIPLLDSRQLPLDNTRPENNRYHSLSNKHRYPRIIIPGVDVSSEGDSSEINRNHHPKGQVNPAKNCIPISCQIHSSLFSVLYSASFFSYSSSERPCHPLHIPVGDLPHPHLPIISVLLVKARCPSY